MSFKLGYIADYLEAELVSASGVYDAEKTEIEGISSLSEASGREISFIASKAYLDNVETTQAAAIILTKEFAPLCKANHLIVDNPYVSYAKLTQLFAKVRPEPEIAASAVIAPTASIGLNSHIAANAVIGEDAVIGENCYIGANVSVGTGAKIGPNSHLYANVSIYHDVEIGSDCIIHSGTVIGSDGFGFAPTPDGYVKIHQLGSVVIGNRVEIGANTSIDRGALGNTEIHDGAKIDNLVHIAHNCVIGANTALAGQVGMAGTTHIGENCTFGGQVGIVGHLEIADSVHVTGKSMITKGISEPGLYSSGTGFSDNRTWRKNTVRFNQLNEIYKRLLHLEKHANKQD